MFYPLYIIQKSTDNDLLQYTVTGALRTAQTMQRLTKKMKCDLQTSLRPYPGDVSQWGTNPGSGGNVYNGIFTKPDLSMMGMAI